MAYSDDKCIDWKIGYWKGYMDAINLIYPTDNDLHNMPDTVATNLRADMVKLREFLEDTHIDRYHEFYLKIGKIVHVHDESWFGDI